jgi:hypothetical protein
LIAWRSGETPAFRLFSRTSRAFLWPDGYEDIPQGLKPLASIGFLAKAEALAYLEAKTKALPENSSAIALRTSSRLLN